MLQHFLTLAQDYVYKSRSAVHALNFKGSIAETASDLITEGAVAGRRLDRVHKALSTQLADLLNPVAGKARAHLKATKKQAAA